MKENAALAPFSPFRLPFSGMRDTAKCIEVDLSMNRIYVASAATGVFVWNFCTRDPVGVMEHNEWVNSVRCFPPPYNSLSQEDYDEMRSLVSSGLPGFSSPYIQHSKSGTRFVLTASEDGIISSWCPYTFIVKQRIRPGSGAVTALQLAPVQNDEKRFITADGFLLYAASLRHVYVLRIAPEFQLLHDLVHEGQVLCMTPFNGAFSKCLLCGQDTGCIAVWHLSSGQYLSTVHYPADAPDIEKDSKVAVIHSPELDDIHNLVRETFYFNHRRSKAQSDKRIFVQKEKNQKKYIRKMKLELDSLYVESDEAKFTQVRKSMNEGEKKRSLSTSSTTTVTTTRRSSQMGSIRNTSARHTTATSREYQLDDGASGTGTRETPDSTRKSIPANKKLNLSFSDTLSSSVFDLRRVTCLATGAEDAKQSNRFYSGHGTGEVLIWEATFPDQPFLLLKKIQVFEFGSWVWNMQAMEVGKEEEVHNEPFQPYPSAVTLQLCVWEDSGAVRYIQAIDHVVIIEGPGFLCTSSYFIRTCKMNFRGEKERVRTIDLRCTLGATLSSSVVRQKSIIRPAAYYLIMGSFEGRVEIFDISNLVAKLRRAGK